MKIILKNFLLSGLVSISSFALEINEQIASKLAKDSYLSKNDFAKNYKTKHNSIITAQKNGVRYYLLEDNQNTVIVIRGTDNIRNAITDVMAVDSSFLGDETLIVHQGFYDVAKKLFKSINLNPKKPVIIIGHSLGGAVSLLYGAMLAEKNIDVALYTFGMPPIANKQFLQHYDKLKHERYFHIFDPVSSLSKPTIQLFETQMKFKSFESLKGTISNMISTIQNIPDKYRHHGVSHPITDKLHISEEQLNQSLFFKTCTLYFDYHKIDNYIYALSKHLVDKRETKKKKQQRKIKIIPSVVKGTTPLEVEFYIDTQDIEIDSYYFNFAGKEQITKTLNNNKISYTFRKKGQHKVVIALKDKNSNVVSTTITITTREPTFQEYQDAILKGFDSFKQQN
ncbi:MAG: lipase family protein [Arcobacteraceae bacterium]